MGIVISVNDEDDGASTFLWVRTVSMGKGGEKKRYMILGSLRGCTVCCCVCMHTCKWDQSLAMDKEKGRRCKTKGEP